MMMPLLSKKYLMFQFRVVFVDFCSFFFFFLFSTQFSVSVDRYN